MAVVQPSEPEKLMFNGKLSFCCPRDNGGSRISVYEVSCYFVISSFIKVVCIRYIFKMMKLMSGSCCHPFQLSHLQLTQTFLRTVSCTSYKEFSPLEYLLATKLDWVCRLS